MAHLIIKYLDDSTLAALTRRARLRGWSLEEEVRHILRCAVHEAPSLGTYLGSRMASRFIRYGLHAPLLEWKNEPIEPMETKP